MIIDENASRVSHSRAWEGAGKGYKLLVEQCFKVSDTDDSLAVAKKLSPEASDLSKHTLHEASGLSKYARLGWRSDLS